MSGLLTPEAALREFSDLGLVLAGAKLYTYVSGTPSTPLATYSESTLVTPNTNPIIASAGGQFGPIYLTPGVAYKYLLTDANDVTVPGWPRDPIMVPVSGYTDGSLIKAADGTVGAPGLTFNSDPDTGLYRDGTNGLALATAGVKALGIDSTQFIDSPTQPRCVAYHNTVQNLANNTATVLLLNSEDLDVGALHDLVTNNSRLTVPAGGDGFYAFVGRAWYVANGGATGVFKATVRKNGATSLEEHGAIYPVGVGAPQSVMVSGYAQLAAADYLELLGYQFTGGALDSGSVTRAQANMLSLVKLW